MNVKEKKMFLENTFSYQAAKFRASIFDLMLIIGEPIWKFIKRHPRLHWLWNKNKPLIDAICWFFPFDWEKK